jgi:hypothetical protein
MFEQSEHVRSPYEVVKTVGFDLETTTDAGRILFSLRVEVVRFIGAEDYAPMIWQVTREFGDALLLHTAPTASAIRGRTPEEVIEGVLKSFEPVEKASAPQGADVEGT